MKTRICVIGAGASGLCLLEELRKLDTDKFEISCFERYDKVGGLWNFTYVAAFVLTSILI